MMRYWYKLTMLDRERKSPRFDSSIVTTQRALASLMFQLEMTVPLIPPRHLTYYISLIFRLSLEPFYTFRVYRDVYRDVYRKTSGFVL